VHALERQQLGFRNNLNKRTLPCSARAVLQGLREMFAAFDADHTGRISVEELRDALEKKGAHFETEEVKKLVRLCAWVQCGCALGFSGGGLGALVLH